MPPTLTFTKQADIGDPYQIASNPGCVFTATGKIIACALNFDAGGDYYAEFWRSSDDGISWVKTSSKPFNIQPQAVRFANVKGGRIIFPLNFRDEETCSLIASTDDAASWQTVLDISDGSGTGHENTCAAILTYGNGNAIAIGLIATTARQGYNSDVARTINGGASWSIEAGNVIGPRPQFPTCGAVGGNGKMIVGYRRAGYYLSADNGANWSAAGALPAPPGALNFECYAATYLTEDHVLVGGHWATSGADLYPPLYRSANGGASWTHVEAAHIQDWPSSGTILTCMELHRIFAGAAIMGLGHLQERTFPPWRYSIDGGSTWQSPATPGKSWSSVIASAAGGIIQTSKGTLISVVESRSDAGNQNEIWRGVWSC